MLSLRCSPQQCCQWLMLLSLACLSGCGGCQPDSGESLTREELEKRAREQREALQVLDLASLPTDANAKIVTAKPGHWTETRQRLKANREDLQVVTVGRVAQGSAPASIPGTEMVNEFSRRTSLPKGQTKSVDLQYFVPYTGTQSDDPFVLSPDGSSKLNFRTELLSWPLLTPILGTAVESAANELKPHEFLLMVLSPQAMNYEYLGTTDAVFWRGDELFQEERIRSYTIKLVKPEDNQYAIPHTMLCMTSLAVLVWDDVAVDNLSSEQQRAILDWLHWGGTLVVSGPSSWSRLQNTFLSPYLPANSATAVELTSASFEQLSATWTTLDRFAPEGNSPLTVEGPPVAGLEYQLNERGSWLPGSGELVAEAAVGRGRIALTAFPLREPRIFRWKFFSSFVSTGLLRRPPRTMVRNTQTRTLEQVWDVPWRGYEQDPRLNTNFRIASRDLPLTAGPSVYRPAAAAPAPTLEQPLEAATSTDGLDSSTQAEVGDDFGNSAEPTSELFTAADFNVPKAEPGGDLESARWGNTGAAWNDYSGLSVQALSALKGAAGIELPSRQTIVWLLTGYLVCLVPVNWLVFRLLGRLEYAWVAAPLLALIAVGVVTRVARLDIGFARRTTELSLLELHADYPRGHLTRYIALYTSLSTNYAVDFPESDSVALPMGDLSRTRRRAAAQSRLVRTNYGRSAGVTLEPLTVYSNSTEMLHAEQIIDLPGGIKLGQTAEGTPAIKNDSGLELQSALVVRCTAPESIQACWVGDLSNTQNAALTFAPVDREQPWQQWNQTPATRLQPATTSEPPASDELWIGGILRELLLKTPLAPGQIRLLAFTDNRPGQLQVTPVEDQFDGRCVVMAHLTSPELRMVRPDPIILSRAQSTQTEPVVDDQQAPPP